MIIYLSIHQIEDVCGVMDQLIEDYMDEVVPIAAQLAAQLVGV